MITDSAILHLIDYLIKYNNMCVYYLIVIYINSMSQIVIHLIEMRYSK